MITRIRAGERPSRPKGENQWLQRRVWSVVTAGWAHGPEKRCELSEMYRVFSTSAQRDQGDLNSQNGGDLMISKMS